MLQLAKESQGSCVALPSWQVASMSSSELQHIDDSGVFVAITDMLPPGFYPSPFFSILICATRNRAPQRERLVAYLRSQGADGRLVAIEVDDDPSRTIGEKRYRMLEHSNAEYVAFVDDDDRVTPHYISSVLSALIQRPDCVGMRGIYTVNGKNPQLFEHSLKHESWYTDRDTNVHIRPPNHLNPVRLSLALQAGFPDLDHGEDRVYSERLRPLLKDEYFLEEPIYYYWFRTKARHGA